MSCVPPPPESIISLNSGVVSNEEEKELVKVWGSEFRVSTRVWCSRFGVQQDGHATEWSSKALFPQIYGGYMTKFASRKALKSIALGKLTFGNRVVLHRAARWENPEHARKSLE